MTIEEIRKNAPSGATHCEIDEQDAYWKYDGFWKYYTLEKGWVSFSRTMPSFIKPL